MRKPVTVRRMMTDVGSISFRGKGGPTPRDRTCLGLAITDKGSLNFGSLGLIGRGLSLVEEELVDLHVHAAVVVEEEGLW